jgi:hypothetical protein
MSAHNDELETFLQSGLALGLVEEGPPTDGRPTYGVSKLGAEILERRISAAEMAAAIIAIYERLYAVNRELGWEDLDEAALVQRYEALGVSKAAERVRAHHNMRRLYDLAKAGQGGAILGIFESSLRRPPA